MVKSPADDRLTDAMRRALWIVAWGTVTKRRSSWIDEEGGSVDGRSIEALFRRGLIDWQSVAKSGMTQTLVTCTEAGYAKIEEMRREEYSL